MEVKIQSIHFDADVKLLDFIQHKLDKIEHFYDGIMGGEVFLRLDHSADAQNKVAEIKLLTRTGDMFAKRKCRTFEEAVIETADALSAQVKKHKEKIRRN